MSLKNIFKKTLITGLTIVSALSLSINNASAYYSTYYYDNYDNSLSYQTTNSYNYSNTYYNNNRYSYNRTANDELNQITDLDGNVISGTTNYNDNYNSNYCYDSNGNRVSCNNYRNQTQVIEIKNNKYSPSTITIKVGDTVKWINRDSTSHTISGDRASYYIESAKMNKDYTYQKTFSKSGTYYYHCKYHTGMKGKIVVTN